MILDGRRGGLIEAVFIEKNRAAGGGNHFNDERQQVPLQRVPGGRTAAPVYGMKGVQHGADSQQRLKIGCRGWGRQKRIQIRHGHSNGLRRILEDHIVFQRELQNRMADGNAVAMRQRLVFDGEIVYNRAIMASQVADQEAVALANDNAVLAGHGVVRN